MEASASHQDWFHLGTLYSVIPTSFYKLFSKNLNTVLKYCNFKNMNIINNGKLKIIPVKSGWFKSDRIENRFISNTLINKSIRLLSNFRISKLKKRWIKHKANGIDVSMNSHNIGISLLSSFLNKGELILGALVINHKIIPTGIKLFYKKDDKIKTIEAYKIIYCTGEKLSKISNKINNIYSPISVIYPALDNTNFVKISTKSEETLTHIVHTINNKKYSVVSSSLYTQSNKEIEELENKLLCIIKKNYNIDNKTVVSYIGTKTEYDNFGSRNYKPFIKKLEPNVYLAIPAKFTLSFQLAINIYTKLEKINPVINPNIDNIDNMNINKHMISEPTHKIIIKRILNEKY